MIEVIKHNNLKVIEKKWKSLFNTSKNYVPNAEFEFVEKFNKGLIQKIKTILNKSSKIICFEVVDNGETRLILPCSYEKGELVSLYTLDYYEVLFNQNDNATKILTYLKEIAKVEKQKIELKRFKDDGATYLKLKEDVQFVPYNECVKIEFDEDYEKYYSSLSKSARQNLRTAYNRANTDGFKFDFKLRFGKVDQKLKKQLNKIYLNRRVSKYNNMGLLKKILFSMNDRVADVCFDFDNTFCAYLSLDNKPVAFMAGFVNVHDDGKRELIVPRLAINDKYARYSLGIMLVNETIKQAIKEGISVLDLSTGTETYKFQMGGKSHFVYNLIVGEE